MIPQSSGVAANLHYSKMGDWYSAVLSHLRFNYLLTSCLSRGLNSGFLNTQFTHPIIMLHVMYMHIIIFSYWVSSTYHISLDPLLMFWFLREVFLHNRIFPPEWWMGSLSLCMLVLWLYPYTDWSAKKLSSIYTYLSPNFPKCLKTFNRSVWPVYSDNIRIQQHGSSNFVISTTAVLWWETTSSVL
mgnify:CR=1 FL=1